MFLFHQNKQSYQVNNQTNFLYLMGEVKVWVHLNHFPASIAILINSNKKTGVIFFAPINVKMSCLCMARKHIPVQMELSSITDCKQK